MHKTKKLSYLCIKMKTILKVILVLLLVLAGGRTIADATAEYNGRSKELSLQHHQDNKIEKTVYDSVFSFGDYAHTLIMERIQITESPSGNPTSSPSLLRIILTEPKSMAVSITPRRDKQYDVDAPFYCLLPSEYYVFALRHIII